MKALIRFLASKRGRISREIVGSLLLVAGAFLTLDSILTGVILMAIGLLMISIALSNKCILNGFISR
jgi:hypothetical protein